VTEGVAVLAAGFTGAAGGALVALALSRPVEWVFGYSTRLRLVELLSYEHPLMRRFTERAPGTFQHAVSVALLARHAADAIGADGLLVRVGALYHDVGKTDHPHYFTENQTGFNPHDDMAPQDSARVIREHVTNGVRLLERYGIGSQVADFVLEHHGTSVLASFEAKARAAGAQIDPANYRYAGPRPRSRETAVLMMADQIEATARSLETPTRDVLRDVVGRTMDRVQASGQLDDSPLTLRDLTVLRAAFASGLADLHHTRVAYAMPDGRGAASTS
jgi:putative nucleotidyltransferase with HDIG domain